MTIKVIQAAEANSGGAVASGATISPTISTVGRGNLVVLCTLGFGSGSTGGVTVSDSASQQWIKGPATSIYFSAPDLAIYYFPNSAAITSVTVGNADPSVTADLACCFFEISGIVSSSPLDISVSATSGVATAGTAPSVTGGILAQAKEIAIGFIGWGSTATLSNVTSGWTAESEQTTTGWGSQTAPFYEIVSSTSALTLAGTLSTSQPWGVAMVTFKGSIPNGQPGPAQARIPPKPRLAGVYMGVGPKDISFGTGQIQWTGSPVNNPTKGPVFHPAVQALRAKVPRHPRDFAGWTAGTVPKIIQLVNTAEGGTSGTTASTSNTGGASGNAFDTVSIVANGTLAFDSSEAAHGLLSYKVATGATSGTSVAKWSSSLHGPLLTAWFRVYLYYTANPASASSPVEALAGASAAALITIGSSGSLELFDGTGTGHDTFTNAIPLNRWFRIEGYVTGNASAGAISCSLYTPKDSTTALESHTVTGVNTTGLITQVWYGEANAGTSQGPWWMDDIGVSNTGYLGPAGGNIPPGDYGLLDSYFAAITTTF